jgi:hypothetical protein
LERVPDNSPRRVADVFADSVIGQARCRRLIDLGALVPSGRRGYYKLDDWTLADILNDPPTGGNP